jgi:hypothetical protein
MPLANYRLPAYCHLPANYLLPAVERKTLTLGGCSEVRGTAMPSSQAIRALREAQIEVVLVNPNIASVQASPGLLHKDPAQQN